MKSKRASKKVSEVFMVYLGPGDKKKLFELAKAEERSGSYMIRKWIRTEAEALPK
jgi:predicted transcriptional regulator